MFKDNEENYYELRKKIADEFNISWAEIFISGSAKLGFSPHKETEFSLESDIDVAIISQELYNDMMWKICLYETQLRLQKVSENDYRQYQKFLRYSALGWIRPDLLPISFQFKEIKTNWFDFFNSISYGKSEVGNYKVSAGIFQTYRHFENYTISGFKKLLSVKL